MSDRNRLGLLHIADEQFVSDLQELLSLSVESIDRFGKFVNNEEGFGPKNEDDVDDILKIDGISADNVNSIFAVAKFLYDTALSKGVEVDDLIEELGEYCKERDIGVEQEKFSALRKLLDIAPASRARNSIIPYAMGVVPSIHSISVVNDLRAVFGGDEEDVQHLIPIFIVRLKTIDDAGEKDDFVFQSDMEGIGKLIDNLSRHRESMRKVFDAYNGDVSIYLPEESVSISSGDGNVK